MISLNEIAAEQGLEPEDVAELLQDFLEYTEHHDLTALRNALNNRDFAELRKAAHSIKGAALNLRLNEIAEQAKRLELCSDSKDTETLLSFAEKLEDGLRTLAEFLRNQR